jgi:hypothetical protein
MTGKLLLAKLLHKPRGKANQARGERKLGGKTKNQMAAGSKQVGRYWEAVTQADQAHSQTCHPSSRRTAAKGFKRRNAAAV